MRKFKVITLCGSIKFKDDFLKLQSRLALEGNVVILPVFFDEKIWNNLTEQEKFDAKKLLGEIHKQKIDMADEIFVVNKGGYIGESTQNEINFAISLKKPVKFLE